MLHASVLNLKDKSSLRFLFLSFHHQCARFRYPDYNKLQNVACFLQIPVCSLERENLVYAFSLDFWKDCYRWICTWATLISQLPFYEVKTSISLTMSWVYLAHLYLIKKKKKEKYVFLFGGFLHSLVCITWQKNIWPKCYYKYFLKRSNSALL